MSEKTVHVRVYASTWGKILDLNLIPKDAKPYGALAIRELYTLYMRCKRKARR